MWAVVLGDCGIAMLFFGWHVWEMNEWLITILLLCDSVKFPPESSPMVLLKHSWELNFSEFPLCMYIPSFGYVWKWMFLSQIISKPFSKYYTFHEIYHQTPCQWPVWCVREFYRHKRQTNSQNTWKNIPLSWEWWERPKQLRIYFQAEHIWYKGLGGGRQADMKSSKADNNNHYSSQAKKGNGGETDSDIDWDRKAGSDGFMRRIMEGCPFFSSVEFAEMVRSLYIIHPEEGNWNQLIPDLDGGLVCDTRKSF